MILVVSIFLSSNVLNLPQHIRFARSSKYNYNEAGKAMTLILQQSKSNHIGFSNIRLDIIHYLELSGLVHDSKYRFRFSTDEKFKCSLKSENYTLSFQDVGLNMMMIDFFNHDDPTYGYTMDTDGHPVLLVIQPGKIHISCNENEYYIELHGRSLEYQTWSNFGRERKLF